MERQSMRTTRLPGSWLPGVVRYLLLSWLAFWGLSGPAFGDTQVYYIHTDHLGTPQVITDQNQEVAWQADYEPFGEATVTTAVIDNPLRFPGQYFDAETGLHYNYFRDYDPTTGSYIESDPVGLAGGLNTYSYVDSNPLSWIDPSGLTAVPIPAPMPPPGGQSTGIGGYDWNAPFWPKWMRGLFDPYRSESSDNPDCPPEDDYPADPDDWTPPDGWEETPAGEKTGGRHRQWKGPDGKWRRWDKEGRKGGKERGPHWHDWRYPGDHIDPTR